LYQSPQPPPLQQQQQQERHKNIQQVALMHDVLTSLVIPVAMGVLPVCVGRVSSAVWVACMGAFLVSKFAVPSRGAGAGSGDMKR
jgi:hypothetical protein